MFPSIISTFNIVSPTDRLNSPSHSALHNSVSSVLTQVQTVIGLSTSSALGSLMYDVRSPLSNGGGHVQTANKGGTGQTSYTKGDLLVATSSSVIAKLAVSSVSGDVLVADPNQNGGMKWAPVVANKVAVNTTSVTAATGFTSVANVLYSTSILGSVLGTNGAIRFAGEIRRFDSDDDFSIVVNYGNNIISSVTLTQVGSIIGAAGEIYGTIVSGGTALSQRGYVGMRVTPPQIGIATSGGKQWAMGQGAGNSSVNSSANQNLVITGQYSADDAKNSILAGIFVVEKIV